MREILKALRKENNKTQLEMAELLHISKSTYVKYETGDRKPNYKMLLKIADYFNVTTDYLLKNNAAAPDQTTLQEQDKGTVGSRLKQVRMELLLTQEEFSKSIKEYKQPISRTHYSNIENDNVTISTSILQIIADNYNISLEWLLHGKGNMFTNNNATAAPDQTAPQEQDKGTIGSRLKQIRGSKGINQTELAKIMLVSASYISKVESDKEQPSDMFLKLMSFELNVSFKWLLSGIGNMFTNDNATAADSQNNEIHSIPSSKEKDNIVDFSTYISNTFQDDVSEVINEILEAEYTTERKDIFEILHNNQFWNDKNSEYEKAIDNLRTFINALSGNTDNGKGVDKLEDLIIDLQNVFGDASYIAGLKKGINLMRWCSGSASADHLKL